MNEPNDLIQRQGFEAWADNIIVNVIEDLGTTPFEYVAEEDDVTVHVRLQDGSVSATVRAYIPGKGWHYHDRVIKMGVRK
jgi:hypothetical protein